MILEIVLAEDDEEEGAPVAIVVGWFLQGNGNQNLDVDDGDRLRVQGGVGGFLVGEIPIACLSSMVSGLVREVLGPQRWRRHWASLLAPWRHWAPEELQQENHQVVPLLAGELFVVEHGVGVCTSVSSISSSY